MGAQKTVHRHRFVAPSEVSSEIARYNEAVERAQQDLREMATLVGDRRAETSILEAYVLMVADETLAESVRVQIETDRRCVEWAVSNAIEVIANRLAAVDDPYLRERSHDVEFVGDRLLRALGTDVDSGALPALSGPSIIIARDLSPADTAAMVDAPVVGFVTEMGTRTSHTSIMARALEIPAIVGVNDVLHRISAGDTVIVDGLRGTVVVRPTPEQLDEARGRADRHSALGKQLQASRHRASTTKDGVPITLRANVELPAEAILARDQGAEGIGLYRTEFVFMDRDVPPSEDEHYRHAKNVLRKLAPYPVVFRTFDLGADKRTRLIRYQDREHNPAMGLRSLRLALRERDMFRTQLCGLLRAAVHGPLRIMLPLVSGMAELRAALEVLAEAKTELSERRIAHAQDVPLGIMVEMPSAAIVADVLAKHVDFMSIGTNDLIQYTLAIDRENDDVNYLYEPLHPAIVRMIKMICDAGAKADVPVSLCGEMASDPRYTWVLVGLGLRELSMQASAIPVVKNIIRASSLDEMEALATAVLACETASEARRLVVQAIGQRFGEHLQHTAGLTPEERDDPSISSVRMIVEV
jgi:phosphotransferase system enzyme I (PtsI)